MSILKQFSSLAALSVLAYPLSFANQLLLSHYFGTSGVMDAYWTGMAVVGFVGFFAHPFREALSSEYHRKRKRLPEQAKQFFSRAANLCIVVIAGACLLMYVFRGEIAAVVAGGSAAELALQTAVLMPFFTIFAAFQYGTDILSGVLVAGGRVLFQTLGRILGTAGSMCFVFLLAARLGVPAMLYGLIFAQLLLFALQVKELRSLGVGWKPLTLPGGGATFFGMSGSLAFTAFMTGLCVLYGRGVLAGFGEGVISGFQYAHSLAVIPENIIAVSLSAVLWPRIMEHIAQAENREEGELRALMVTGQACRLLALVMGFIAVFSWCNAHKLIHLVYYRGAFDLESLRVSSQAMQAVVLSLPLQACALVIARAFVSLQHTRALTVTGLSVAAADTIALAAAHFTGSLWAALLHYTVGIFGGLCAATYFLAREMGNGIVGSRVAWWVFRYLLVFVLFLVLFPATGADLAQLVETDKLSAAFSLAVNVCLTAASWVAVCSAAGLIPRSWYAAAMQTVKRRR